MTNRYQLIPARFEYALGVFLDINQINGLSVNQNATRGELIPAGNIDRAEVDLSHAAPVISFTTRDLVSFFTPASPSLGLCIDEGAVFNVVERSECGGFKTTGVTYSCTAGFLEPVSISASQDNEDGVMLSAEYRPLWSRQLDPVVRTPVVDISGVTPPAFNSKFYLGPVYYGATRILGLTSVNIDFGINYVQRAFSGDQFPTTGSILTRTPTLTFSGTDAAMAVMARLFVNDLASLLEFYFVQTDHGLDRLSPSDDTKHIRFSVGSGEWCEDDFSYSQNEDGTGNWSIRPTTTMGVTIGTVVP